MMRVKAPLFSWAKESVNTPHSWGWMETCAVDGSGRLEDMLEAIGPARAGDAGWSVATTLAALARAQMSEGRAAPGWDVSWRSWVDEWIVYEGKRSLTGA